MSEKTLLDKWLKLQEQIKMEFDKYRETRFWSYQMNVMEEKMVGLLWEFGSALQQHQKQLQDLLAKRRRLPHARKELASREWLLKYVQDTENFYQELDNVLRGVGEKKQ